MHQWGVDTIEDNIDMVGGAVSETGIVKGDESQRVRVTSLVPYSSLIIVAWQVGASSHHDTQSCSAPIFYSMLTSSPHPCVLPLGRQCEPISEDSQAKPRRHGRAC